MDQIRYEYAISTFLVQHYNHQFFPDFFAPGKCVLHCKASPSENTFPSLNNITPPHNYVTFING